MVGTHTMVAKGWGSGYDGRSMLMRLLTRLVNDSTLIESIHMNRMNASTHGD